jgi:hypothetical protein
MNQLLSNNPSVLKNKRNKCELLIEQRVEILEFNSQNPELKQVQCYLNGTV